MSDCHRLFLEFHDVIKLSDSKKESLRSARDAIRDRITTHFRDTIKEKIPGFMSQGSFAISSVVNPLNSEFDIDDGIYLNKLDDDMKKWPSPDTVHSWVLEAVKSHTKEDPINKRTCIRVVYSHNYHVDLPIYGVFKGDPWLAEKGEAGWHISDPQKFVDWFIGRVKEGGEQLRRTLLYLKAWADYNSNSSAILTSFALSILVATSYVSSERDDRAFVKTIKSIFDKLSTSHIITNPVDSRENVGERITDAQWNHSTKRLISLLASAGEALKTEKMEEASELWRKEFGERFPQDKGSKEGNRPLKTSAPAILHDDGRSAS
jgi:hypothetical protein